ncbi:porin family protein [Altibacter sp. HG106]|uniref:porin family protein n=1 Tax=Altibacter sp. HG106 TaxID=3023937 RepID=UPI0023502077|nr:porin family protein [Altibacter sp. HG106]MDC7996190.1 porin family protein [Altibacter sp. HG106]
MKKLLLLFLFSVFFSLGSFAQTQFGFKAGYNNFTSFIESDGIKFTESSPGVYAGFLADITVSENFHLQPEAIYSHIFPNQGDAYQSIYIPVLGKYYIAESGFHLMAGPQAHWRLELDTEVFNAIGIDAIFGAGFDITKHFFAEIRYGFELTNRFKDDVLSVQGTSLAKLRARTLQIGVGYKL